MTKGSEANLGPRWVPQAQRQGAGALWEPMTAFAAKGGKVAEHQQKKQMKEKTKSK